MRCWLLILSLGFIASPALAQDSDFCVDRPGLGTPACTIGRGQVMLEVGLLGWDHLADSFGIEDDLSSGDVLMRVGIDDLTELRVGLGGYRSVRSRSLVSARVSRNAGFGDVMIGLQRSLSGPGGPIAVQGFVTVPVGHSGIGAGDWGAGLLVPMGIDLPAGFELDLTPELDAAVNSSGSGRHLAWGGVVGINHALGHKLAIAGELGAWRDNDPAGHSTGCRAALSLAWQAGPNLQIDLEGDLGLTSAAPDHSLMIGFARRF